MNREVDRYNKRNIVNYNGLHSPHQNLMDLSLSTGQSFGRTFGPSSSFGQRTQTDDDRKRGEIMEDKPYGLTST